MRNRIALVVSAMLVVGLVAGLATSASGAGDPGAAAAKKKKKKVCPAGTHKVTVKKKNGKKKKKCVADTTTPTPTPGSTTLTISPTNFTYPDTQHRTGALHPRPVPHADVHGHQHGRRRERGSCEFDHRGDPRRS